MFRRLVAALAITAGVVVIAAPTGNASPAPHVAASVAAQASEIAAANVAVTAAAAVHAQVVQPNVCVTGPITAPAYTPSYPEYQLQDLSVNHPYGPVYQFQGKPIVLYVDANGNVPNFYGFWVGWVRYDDVYHDYVFWPGTIYRGPITTIPPLHLGAMILIEIPIAQTIGNTGPGTVCG